MRLQLWAVALLLVVAVNFGGAAQAGEIKAADQGQMAEIKCRDVLQCLLNEETGNSAVVSREASRHRSITPEVSWPDASKYAPGSIIIQTPERRLYYVLGGGKALRYRVGVGREGFQWSGISPIVRKQEWPNWHPPAEMIKREAVKGHKLPDEMAGGPNNPLGARAMYIGGTLYRIHGSNDASSIGSGSSSGCIRMLNSDVMELYDRVKIGALVYVYQ